MKKSMPTQYPEWINQILKNWQLGAIEKVEPIASFWGKTRLITTSDVPGCILIREDVIAHEELMDEKHKGTTGKSLLKGIFSHGIIPD